MDIQQRLLKFITLANWILLAASGMAAYLFAPPAFATGIICGGLIVTINFHMLYRTLKKALTPPHLSSHNVVIAKYYVRFIISAVIIYLLIYGRIVNPLGLLVGLSVVIISIILGTMLEFKKLFLKEVT
ncbi:MAG: hypothetical protein B6245_08850 [Desulfobacteraceae bacterium 4572_88]|nr:MAG: hypothetical protein B6245_08850 [Desulfobacteraceae bacterium 4572_88]